MKRITMILIAALMLALPIYDQSKTTAQTTANKQAAQPTSGNVQTGSVKRIQVTLQTLASLQAGKPYIIDLSRNGTVYYLASGVDYSRIQVRTSSGTLESLPNLLKKAGSIGKTIEKAANLILGTASDIPRIGGNGLPSCSPGQGVLICHHTDKTSFCWCSEGK